jgi:hypothetical protein
MRAIILAAAVLLAAVAPGLAEEPPAPAAPADTVCFRVEVGLKPGRIVDVELQFDGTGACVAAVLDLDGDGKLETKQEFAESPDPRTQRMTRDSKVRVVDADGEWVLDLYSYKFARSPASARGAQTYAHWSVTKGDFYAWFINVPLAVHPTLEAARAAKPFRLGPPLTFATGASLRGRSALVNVGLKDANGGTLRLARRGNVEVRPEVKLVAGDKEVFSASATYG